MHKSTDIRITNASVTLDPYNYQRGFAFGGHNLTSAKMIKAEVTVETQNGKHALGIGAVPTGYQWAWPTLDYTPDQVDAVMKTLIESIFDLANHYHDFGHPMEICYNLSAEYEHLGKIASKKLKPNDHIPELAVLLAASSLESAIFDAYGQLHHDNIYKLLGKNHCNEPLHKYLDDNFKDEYPEQYMNQNPAPSMLLCHTIGINDPLTPGDVASPKNDGLPEHLVDWVKGEGIRVFKVKLTADVKRDFERLKNIDAAVSSVYSDPSITWTYSVDANEHFKSVDDLIELLKMLKKDQPKCYDRINLIEQPFPRKTFDHPDFNVKRVAEMKPVIIDESLLNYNSLLTAREQGYQGIALKTCKGMVESLLMVAASSKFGMSRAMMDLTCPGLAFLHAAAFASRIPGLTIIEGNGRQFCPNANKNLMKAHGNTFKATNGIIDTSKLTGPGLGF